MVSVIVPVFNRVEQLSRTVKSVQAQTYGNWELILIDDGSTDGSVDLAREFSGKDERVKCFRRDQLPKGAPTCRNMGLAMAKGTYLMFLDSDDLLSPHCFRNRLSLIEKTAYDFIVTQTGIIRNNDINVESHWSSLRQADDIEGFLKFDGWCISSTFFRSEFVRQYRFDENALSIQDWEFHLKILLDKPDYAKYPESDMDIYVTVGHAIRITKKTLGLAKLRSRFQVFLVMENLMTKKGHEHLIHLLDKQYFHPLKLAVLNLPLHEYKELFHLWRASKTYNMLSAKWIRAYLSTQLLVKRLRLKFMFGAIYRIARLFAPRRLFAFDYRESPLAEPLVLEKELQEILADNQVSEAL